MRQISQVFLVTLFSLTFHLSIRSTFPLFFSHPYILCVNVVPLAQLPSLVLGLGLGIVRTALIGAVKSSICLPERGAVR